MRRYRIFVSGVQNELKRERKSVKELILGNSLLREHFEVFLFEDTPANSKSASNLYIDKVDRSDIYICILGNEYGSVGKAGISATEAEFKKAQETNKKIYVYIKGRDDSKRDEQVRKLIKKIRDPECGYSYKRFKYIDDLKNNIYESLIDFLREEGVVGRTAFDNAICEGASFNDINTTKLQWFLKIAKKERNFPISERIPPKDIFTHLNLLHDGRLTNAAILLFGNNPQKFYLQAETKCIQFADIKIKKPFVSYQIYKGNLFDQIDRAVSFVLSSIRLPIIQQRDTTQVSRPLEIPEFAIQESIVNAVAHRNYNPSAGIQVMVFLNRIEVWNPGKLPDQISIKDLKRPHASYPTNPLIAEVLYLANYIQKAGSGTLEMIEQCRQQGLPEPNFISIRKEEFRAILSRDIFTDDYLNKLGVNERQIKAIEYIRKIGQINNTRYQELTNVSKPTATRDLQELIKKSVLQKSGVTGKGTSYRLKGS